ncbi:MAG: S9 family peptidase [Acidobacteriota bacterium]
MSGNPLFRRRLSRVLGLAVSCACLALGLGPSVAASETAGLTAHDLVTMQRIVDPQPSPDGTRVAFVLRTTDLEADRGRTDLWLVPTDGSASARRLTTHEASDFSPRWSPDGRSIFFQSTRSGSSQVWSLPLDGGEARQVTDLPLDVGVFVLSPDGEHLAVTLEVFPGCVSADAEVSPNADDLACTTERLEARESGKTTGVVYDQLFVRHWDQWKDGRRSHLFVVPVDGEGAPVDVTAGWDADVPSKPFGGAEEITFTPDGEGLVFVARIDDEKEPWSTNFDLWRAPLDGSSAPVRLTDNPAWDTQPVFSPDGSTLAYLAMERPGYESDRLRIVLRRWPDGGERVLSADWDRSAGSLTWDGEGRLFVTAQDTGNHRLFAVDVATGAVQEILGRGHVRSPAVAGERLVFGRDTLESPVDLYTLPLGPSETMARAEAKRLTAVNDDVLESITMGAYEQFSFAGWNGETVYGYLIKPAGFEAGTSYPVAFLIHGGPQGSFDNDFHYRWNPQTYAGAGYAVVMIDFHGSTGYGQAFTDSIAGDWGGKPLVDLQKGWAHALEAYGFLDGERACALGASYGGYMINWLAGQWPDGFNCLVNHDGLFDMRSMYYTTEELWFPEWEMGGPEWQRRAEYTRWSPSQAVEKWTTPMLVIHGALDYRVPLTEGLATFTALQRRGVPSKFLYFPDENHWVLKPNNSIQWHEVVLDWLGQWTGAETAAE